MLSLTFLGTSSALPSATRSTSAMALRVRDTLLRARHWVLIDCGEGTQLQAQRAGLSLSRLEAVCISHAHGDHCYGLPGLLASAGLRGRSEPLTLIAPAEVHRWLRATFELTFTYLPYRLEHVDVADLARSGSLTLMEAGGTRLRVSAWPLHHRVPSHAFRLDLDQTRSRLRTEVLESLGVRPGPQWGALRRGEDITWEGRTVTASQVLQERERSVALVAGGDNDDPGLLTRACQGVSLLVHEATYSRAALARVGPQHMHACAGDVAAFAAGVGVGALALTHFSARHHGQDQQALLAAEAAEVYGGRLIMAADLLEVSVSLDGQVTVAGPGRGSGAAGG